ncbi:MAG TPA: hypothetical protein VGH42_14175 [Verrucomicrobiae bacterium]|jgi:hypothetical protein
MNHRERLKLLLRSQLFYAGALMAIAGLVVCSIVDEKDGAQIVGAILAQGGIIIGLWAYRQTRFIVAGPASQVRLKRRSRMGLTLGVGMICVCFILTPVILRFEIPKMPGFLFWYSMVSGLIGLLGLVGLFIWLKRSSGR